MTLFLNSVSVSSNDGTPLIKNITCSLPLAGMYGIYGPGGCGKTTLAYAISGIIPKFLDYEISGTVKIADRDMAKISKHEIGKVVGIVFQNPDYQIFFHSVDLEIGFPISFDSKKVNDIADTLGISHLLNRPSDQLSYGEKKLVILASNLTLSPKAIILDEVFSSLDEKYEQRIFTLLQALSQKGMTVIIIENTRGKIPLGCIKIPFSELKK